MIGFLIRKVCLASMKKNRPSNYWNIGKIECWLSDMASEGYLLEIMDRNFCEFKESEPTKLDFRIEIGEARKNLSEKQKEKYMEDTWTKVTSYENFHVFSCPSELLAYEPNPSSEELIKVIKPLFHKNLLKLFLWVLIPFLIIRFLPYIASPSFLLTILSGTVLNITLYALYIWFILSSCINGFYQWKLLKRLLKGIPIDHKAPWKKTYWLSSTLWNCKIVLIAVIFLSPLILSQTLLPKLAPKALSADTSPELILRFEDIEKANGSDFDRARFKEGYTSKGIGILSPKQIYSSENITTTNDIYNSLLTEYFELTFPSTQKLIVNAYVAKYDKLYSDSHYSDTETFKSEELKTPYLDYVIYGFPSEDKDNKHIFAAKDGIVLHLQYWGSRDKNELLKAVVDFFNNKVIES